MVTRAFTHQEVRQLRQELGGLRTNLQGTILPALGLTAALNLLGGGFNTATASGLALSSAGYRLTTSLYGLQETIARLLFPIVDAIVPHLANAIDWFIDFNERFNDIPIAVAGAVGALWLLRGPITWLIRNLGRIPWAGLLSALRAIPPLANAAGVALRSIVPIGVLLAIIEFNDEIDEMIRKLTGLPSIDQILVEQLNNIGNAALRAHRALYPILTFQIPHLQNLLGINPNGTPPPTPPPPATPSAGRPGGVPPPGLFPATAPVLPPVGATGIPRLQPPPQQPTAFQRAFGLGQQPAPPTIVNYFNITSYDDQEFIRRLQAIFDQDAVVVP